MFEFNPFSRPVAITEILLLLAVVTVLGFCVGRFILSGRVRSLREQINDDQLKVDEFRKKTY